MNDYTNQKFGSLTFIRPTDKRRSTSPKATDKKRSRPILWELLCDCGATIERPARDVVQGNTSSCGCYRKELGVLQGKKIAAEGRKYHPRISTARERWRALYRDGDISFDTFLAISQLPCHYCGSPPSRAWNLASSRKKHGVSQYQIDEGTFISNGLDRIDSSIGHVLENVVPCCFDCNIMKSNRTVDEFLAHIKKISSFQNTSKLTSPTP